MQLHQLLTTGWCISISISSLVSVCHQRLDEGIWPQRSLWNGVVAANTVSLKRCNLESRDVRELAVVLQYFFSLSSLPLFRFFFISAEIAEISLRRRREFSSRRDIPAIRTSARLSRENSIYPFRRNFNATRIRISRDRSSKRLFEAFDRFDYVKKKKKKKKKKERKKEIKDYSTYTNALNTLSSSAYMF